jgi:hypothetical protein
MGKLKRVIQVLEYMLCMLVMDKPSKWEDYVQILQFSYNNGHHASLKMGPCDALYGRICSTLVIWDNLVKKFILRLEILKEMGIEVANIRYNLKG